MFVHVFLVKFEGKTYTMQGTAQQPGISKSTLKEVFETKIKRESSGLQSVTICVSMIEVYNETFRVRICLFYALYIFIYSS